MNLVEYYPQVSIMYYVVYGGIFCSLVIVLIARRRTYSGKNSLHRRVHIV